MIKIWLRLITTTMANWLLHTLSVLITVCIPSNGYTEFVRNQWMEGSSTIPTSLAGFGGICGEYDEITNDIYLFYYTSAYRYNIDEDIFYPLNISIPENIVCSGQASTKINEIIYAIVPSITHIASYNITSKVFNSNYITSIPWSAGSKSHYQCFTQMDNRYLISVGGGVSDSNYNEYFRVFDTESSTWTQGPLMPFGYSSAGCLIYDNYLFVAGSTTYNYNVSKIYVGDMGSISNYDWIVLEGSISTLVYGARLVLYEDDIYFIGDDGSMDVIDPVTDTIRNNISWTPQYITNPAVMVINHRLFAFGGRTGFPAVVQNKWYYYVLLTTTINPITSTINPLIYSTFNTLYESDAEGSKKKNDTGVYIIVAVVILIVIVAVINLIFCYKKHKRKGGDTDEGQNEHRVNNDDDIVSDVNETHERNEMIEGEGGVLNVVTGEMDENSKNDDDIVREINDTKAKQSEIREHQLLIEWGLDQYISLLIEEKGYDDVEDWKDLSIDDLQTMGLKEGHSKRFVRKVKQLDINGT
eukprot:465519_1